MRKIIVFSFISLDGIMQAPGGPEEDTAGDLNIVDGPHHFSTKPTRRLVK